MVDIIKEYTKTGLRLTHPSGVISEYSKEQVQANKKHLDRVAAESFNAAADIQFDIEQIELEI